MKKALVVIFCVGNANEDLNIDKNIINVNNYLDKRNLAQNKNFTDQKELNIELLNLDTRKSLENLLANEYKKIGTRYYWRKGEKVIKTVTKNPKTSQVSYKKPRSQK